MTKSFLVYNIIEVEGEPVDCIYLTKGECRAQPFARVGFGRGGFAFYTPTETEQVKYCNNGPEFKACPRFVAYQDHLKAIGLVK